MTDLKNCFLLLILLAFTGLHWEKSDVEKKKELPVETQVGKNTFGCLVDGQVWIPEAKTMYPAVNTQVVANLVTLIASKDDELILLRVNNFEKEGTYSLNAESTEFRIGGVEYSLRGGELIITKIDHKSRIISGRFHAVGEQGDKEVILSEGRFDLEFHE